MRLTREGLCAFGLVWLVWQTAAPTAVAARADWCYKVCGSQQGCAEECENDGGGTTTCGDYQGGGANGWCDGDTCDENCGPFSPGSLSCYYQGNLTSCMSYGDYASCGDGVCSMVGGGETRSNCSTDCGEVPDIECGDEYCDEEQGESWRNCADDCDEPQGPYFCGDGRCDPEEGTECEDCIRPQEYCDGWDYFCPSGYDCLNNRCVRLEFLFEDEDCKNSGECANPAEMCVEVSDNFPPGRKFFCFPYFL